MGNAAQKEKLSELQLRVRQLLDQVEQITKEQNYQRYREERFRQTSESTNQRVLWWALAQTGILLVMGAWQIKHLKASSRPRSWSKGCDSRHFVCRVGVLRAWTCSRALQSKVFILLHFVDLESIQILFVDV